MKPQDLVGEEAGHGTTPPFRRRTRLDTVNFVGWLVVGVLVLNVFIGVFVGVTMYQGRLQYEERAATTTQNLATSLQNEIAGMVRTTDFALLAVVDEYERQSASGGIDGRALNAFVKRIKSRLTYLNAIRVANAQGNVILGSDVSPGSSVNVADREYFVRVRDHPDTGVAISRPQKSRVNDKWVIVLARRLEDARGNFAGAVFMPIAVEDLTHTLTKMDVGRKGSITLRGQDLDVIARYPEQAEPTPTGSSIVSREFRSLIESGRDAGTFHAVNPVDQIERTLSYRRVQGYPLHIVVGLAREEYLLQWRIATVRTFVTATVFLLVSLSLSWLVFRYWKQLKLAGDALEHQAHTDFLTGLANRRFFLESAAYELARAARYGQAVSLLMLDIDHFKRINDTYGHMTGDVVLQKLATLCTGTLREVDVMGRWGGEEFAILLPETGLGRAYEVAERIRLAVAAAEIALSHGLPLKLTISIGVAAHIAGEDNIDMLIDRADHALYRAKNAGRNCVRTDEPPQSPKKTRKAPTAGA